MDDDLTRVASLYASVFGSTVERELAALDGRNVIIFERDNREDPAEPCFGVISYSINTDGCYIHDLAVRPAGQGIGKDLLQKIIAMHGDKLTIELSVEPDKPWLKGYYARFGFEEKYITKYGSTRMTRSPALL